MSGNKLKKEIDIQRILEAKKRFLTEQRVTLQQQPAKEPHIRELLKGPDQIIRSLNTQLEALKENSAKKGCGKKRGWNGEKEQPSSGKEKKPHAAISSDNKFAVPAPRQPRMKDAETPLDDNLKLHIHIRPPSARPLRKIKHPPQREGGYDETSEESVLSDSQIKLFVEAAKKNNDETLRSILKGSSPKKRIALISTPAPESCEEIEGVIALEIAVDKEYKKATDTMLNSLLAEEAVTAIQTVWRRIETNQEAPPTQEKCDRWQELLTYYKVLQSLFDVASEEPNPPSASSSSSSSNITELSQQPEKTRVEDKKSGKREKEETVSSANLSSQSSGTISKATRFIQGFPTAHMFSPPTLRATSDAKPITPTTTPNSSSSRSNGQPSNNSNAGGFSNTRG